MTDNAKPETAAHRVSWFRIVMSLSTLGFAALAAAVLFIQFQQNRIMDLRSHTRALAEHVDAALSGALSEALIEPSAPVSMRLGRARWDLFRFRVDAPPHQSVDALVDMVQKAMAAQEVRTEEMPPGEALRGIRLLFGEFPFAEVFFHRDAAPVPAQRDMTAESRRFAAAVRDALIDSGADPAHVLSLSESVQSDSEARWILSEIEAGVPPDLRPGELRGRVEERLGPWDAHVLDSAADAGGAQFTLAYKGKPAVRVQIVDASGGTGAGTVEEEAPAMPPVETLPMESIEGADAAPPPAPAPTAEGLRPRIAIILDDGGYGGAAMERVLALDSRLTLAILPNTPHCEETATRGAELGFEIMLHMPMETDSDTVEAVPGQIFVAMGREEIQKLTRAAIAQIPFVAGVNNHTGSKFTASEKKMGFVLEVLKKESLYFVDSVTGANSVAYETAKRFGVPAARRDVFLDNDTSAEAVRLQYERLLETARARGSAIGIGHFQSPGTAVVLAEELPKLAAAGIDLVHASELVE